VICTALGESLTPQLLLQATAQFAPQEANGSTAEAEGEADAILQTALDAHRPAAQPQLWPGAPEMVPVQPSVRERDTEMAEAGPLEASSSEDEETLAKRWVELPLSRDLQAYRNTCVWR